MQFVNKKARLKFVGGKESERQQRAGLYLYPSLLQRQGKGTRNVIAIGGTLAPPLCGGYASWPNVTYGGAAPSYQAVFLSGFLSPSPLSLSLSLSDARFLEFSLCFFPRECASWLCMRRVLCMARPKQGTNERRGTRASKSHRGLRVCM